MRATTIMCDLNQVCAPASVGVLFSYYHIVLQQLMQFLKEAKRCFSCTKKRSRAGVFHAQASAGLRARVSFCLRETGIFLPVLRFFELTVANDKALFLRAIA